MISKIQINGPYSKHGNRFVNGLGPSQTSRSYNPHPRKGLPESLAITLLYHVFSPIRYALSQPGRSDGDGGEWIYGLCPMPKQSLLCSCFTRMDEGLRVVVM